MTLIAASLSLLGGYLWFAVLGRVMVGPVTVFVAMFVATLATAVFYAYRSKESAPIAGALVLILNFAGSHWAWSQPDPVIWQGAIDLATAAWFILVSGTRWQIAIGALYLISVLVGGLTWLGIVPSSAERPLTFLAISHPDLLSLLGHAANIILGMGAGDAGLVVKDWFRRPSVAGAAGYRFVSRIGRVAKVARSRKTEGE